jgi:hypothetical protein
MTTLSKKWDKLWRLTVARFMAWNTHFSVKQGTDDWHKTSDGIYAINNRIVKLIGSISPIVALFDDPSLNTDEFRARLLA